MAESLRFDLLANDRASAVFDKVGKSASDTESRFSKVSSGLVSFGKVAAAGLAAGGAAAVLGGKHFLNLATSVEAMGAKAKTVFGGQIGMVDQWASKNAAAMGLTGTQATGLAANFADLLIPMGFARKDAAKMSTDVVGLSGALSQWSGGTVSAAEASDVLAKAMLGERDGLKALGISISEADVKARLLKNGQDKLTGAALQQATAQATQQLIMEKSTDAQDAYAKGGSPLLAMQAQMKAKFGEVQEVIATKLTPAFMAIGESVLKFVGQMQSGKGAGGEFADKMKDLGDKAKAAFAYFKTDILPKLQEFAGFITGSVVPALRNLGTFIKQNADFFIPFAAVIVTAVAGFKAYAAILRAVAIVQAAWSAILVANPIGLFVVAIAALVGGLVVAYKRSETFRDIVDGALRAVGKAGAWLWDALKPALEKIKDGFEAVGKAGTWLWNNALQPAFQFIVGGIASILDMWSSMLRALGDVPGFGWAKTAADAMGKAAEKARAMADGINKIPTSKTVSVTVAYKYTGLRGPGGSGPTRGGPSDLGILGRGQVETESFKLGELFAKNFGGGVKARTKLALEATSALVAKSIEKLQTLRDKAAEITSGIADAMKGSLDVGSLGGTNEDGSKMSVTDQLAGFAAQAGSFAKALAAAAAKGLNSNLIAKVANLGPGQGLTAAQALAAMDQAQVASANASLDAVDKYAQQLGQTVLTTTSLPADIAREQGVLDALLAIKADLQNNRPISFTINDATDPDAVVAAIRRYIKRNGKLRDVAAA